LSNLKQKSVVKTQYTLAGFAVYLAEHIPDRYQHAIRYFGLLSPRSKAQTSSALFLLLKQQKRPRPRRLRWADAIHRDFGVHPLTDRNGQRMRWAGRLKPEMGKLNG